MTVTSKQYFINDIHNCSLPWMHCPYASIFTVHSANTIHLRADSRQSPLCM